MNASDARALLVQACRVLWAHGHNDYLWGHVSARDALGRGYWMKPAGLGFDEVTATDIVLVDFDGSVVEGSRQRHSEWPIHAAILAKRPEVGAVVHTHPAHAIALAAAGQTLVPLSHAGTLFTPPPVPRFELTANLITTHSLGAAVAETLGQESACFLVNHGIVTAGPTIQDAVVRAVLLEKACHHQLLALQAGTPLQWPGDLESLEKRSTVWPPSHLTLLWDYLVRSQPDSAQI